MRRSRWIVLAAVPTVLALGAAAFVFLRTQHSLDRTGVEVAREGKLDFELRSLGKPENPGFEAITSPSSYVSGAFYQGRLYLSGPGGLSIYNADYSLAKSYRVGIDLPAAPLERMAVGRLRGASEPELLIATTGQGVLIFSTNGGADGAGSFRQLLPSDADSRDVTSLLPLASGELLLGTRHHGLLSYSGKSLEVYHPELAGLSVTALAADATGFWVGTQNHGVRHWHGGQVDRFEAESLPDVQVDAIAVDDDRVYVGTPLGVEEFDRGRPVRVLAKNLFAHALFADRHGLTVGTIDEGIQRVSLDAGTRAGALQRAFQEKSAKENQTGAGSVQGFIVGEPDGQDDGRVLYAVGQGGLKRQRDDGSWVAVSKFTRMNGDANANAQLSDGNVSALAFDADGRLWVGYFDHGLDVLSPSLQRLAHVENDHVFCVNRMVLDPQKKTMAVATANGLVLFDAQGRQRQVMTKHDGLIADHVTDIGFTGDSMVLATPAGLTFVDPAGARSLYAFEGLVNNHVYALGVQHGEVLAGTLGGISMLQHEDVVRNLTVTNSGLKHNWVTAIVPVEGINGAAWMVGTYGAGVMRMNKDGRMDAMENVTRAMVVNPNAMLVTESHIYAGTLGQGLWVWTRMTGRWRQVMAGLPSENVTAVAEHAGELYVGTENGLVRIEERALE